MPKVRKAELSFLYATRRLIQVYISTTYHQNIPKGIRVTEQTRNQFQTKQREITPNVRQPVVILVLDMSSYPVLHFLLPSITNIFQRVFKLQSGQEVLRRADSDANGIRPKINMPRFLRWGGEEGHNDLQVLPAYHFRVQYSSHSTILPAYICVQ